MQAIDGTHETIHIFARHIQFLTSRQWAHFLTLPSTSIDTTKVRCVIRPLLENVQ